MSVEAGRENTTGGVEAMMQPLHDTSKLAVFFNGVFSEPRLNHAEGIAVDQDGYVWCGGEAGELYRIAPDGSVIEQVSSTGGFALGVTLDASGMVYICDMKLGSVFRYNRQNGEMSRFAAGDGERSMTCPNYAVVDERNRWLYVSDSQENGPGVWRFDLDTGKGGLWYDGACAFANGLALAADGRTLFVAESFASRVSAIGIGEDGAAGEKEVVVVVPDTVPDGILLHPDGRLYISCFEPSSIYRYTFGGRLELLVRDKMAQVLDHPTNLALTEEGILLIANLGAWHIAALDLKDSP